MLTLVLSALLVACGGGGGGGGSGGGDSGFSVTADTSSISLSYEEGSAYSASTSVYVTTHGSYSGALYIGAYADGAGISSTIPLTVISNTQGRFDISAASGLATGTYTGKILLFACSDVSCRAPVGGTPLTVNYSVVVTPGVKVTPSPVTLNAVGNQVGSGQITVTPPSGMSGFTATVASGGEWLELGEQTATTLTVKGKPWRSGTYAGAVRISSGGKVTTVPVNYVVSAPVGGEQDLLVSPSSQSLGLPVGAVSAAQKLAITLPSWGSASDVQISTQYASSAGWLSVTRTATGADVVASTTGLSKGVYSATITFTPAAPGTAVSVPVTLTVGNSGLVQPTAVNVSVNANVSAASLLGSVPVQTNGSATTWTATSSDSWLTLTRAAGATGSNVDYSISSSAVAAWDNFSSKTATVTITPSSANYSMSFTVTVNKALPEVYFIGPYNVISGKETLVHVNGRGFSGVADLAGRLKVGSLTPSQVTLVDDAHLTFKVTPAAAGNHAVEITNAVAIPAASAKLRSLAPVTFAEAVVPTTGAKRTIVYDAERQAVYTVNLGAEAITRFRLNGGTWASDSVSIPSVLDAGMGPDGNSLVVTSTPGTLRLLDPATLASTFTLTYNGGYTRTTTYMSQGIATSNNGWSWLATGTGSWDELAYFDHRTHTMQARPAQSLSTTFYLGPWMSVSRDGERMIVNQSAGISPRPLMLYLDATNPLLKVNPAGLEFSYRISLSDTGDRMLMDTYEVRDSAFGMVGHVVLPDSTYTAMTGVISPDGGRVYVLAYPGQNVAGGMPRVYVLDSSVAAGNQTNLPVMGYKTLTAFPSCSSYSSIDNSCVYLAHAAISPDGNTLFFLGDRNLIVTSTSVPVSPSANRALGRVTDKAKTLRPQLFVPTVR